MMEALFRKMLDHLQNQFPGLGPPGRYKGLPRRFKKTVYGIDSSTIALVSGDVLRDDEVTPKTKSSKADYPERTRRIVARVEVDGKATEMVFITDNMEWAASSIRGLYQSRWAIEVFFKRIKQPLRVCDFPGHSKQAIRWRLWSALPMYLLLRFQAWCSDWPHSFARIFTMIRGVVWHRFDLGDTLAFHGTAGGKRRMRVQPQAACLPGEDWTAYGTASALNQLKYSLSDSDITTITPSRPPQYSGLISIAMPYGMTVNENLLL